MRRGLVALLVLVAVVGGCGDDGDGDEVEATLAAMPDEFAGATRDLVTSAERIEVFYDEPLEGTPSVQAISIDALEAAAPDNQTAATARNAITTMKATREALDARAESRYAYRKAEGDDADADTLAEVRNREVRTSRNLADARSAYAKALSGLAAIA